VLWGVLFPIVAEAVRGETLSVSSPYYDFFAVAFGLPILFLAGVGPLIAWRRASARSVARSFAWPFASAAAMAAILVALGFGSSVPAVVALSLCLFVAVTVGLEFVRGTRARHALGPDVSWPRAFAQLVGRNRRRYGGYVVHLAVVVIVVGMVGTSAYATVTETTLARGQTVRVGDYGLTFTGLNRVERANSTEMEAVLRVTRNGEPFGTLTPGRRFYPREGQTSNEVDIRSSLRNGEDLYTIFEGPTASGGAALKVLVNPLVNLIWLGGLLFAAGVLVAIWPDPRAVRRRVHATAAERLGVERA
jgi:cytochrome c-type biogenesis protein CcmF